MTARPEDQARRSRLGRALAPPGSNSRGAPDTPTKWSRFAGNLLRSLARGLMRLYYPVIEVSHRERLPAKGPVLFVANHPGALLDPPVVGWVTQRPVHFYAKAPLFEVPVFGGLLYALGMVPAYRAADDPANVRRNLETLRAGAAYLVQGEAVGLFPEGRSHDLTRVEMIRSGAARIALQAAADGAPVIIIPLGLNHERKERFRSSVWVRVGRPIAVQALLRAHAGDGRKVLRQLTREIEQRLREVVVHLDEPEWQPFLPELEVLLLPMNRGADGHVRGRSGLSPLSTSARDRPLSMNLVPVGRGSGRTAVPSTMVRLARRLAQPGAWSPGTASGPREPLGNEDARDPIPALRRRKLIADAMNHSIRANRPRAEAMAAAIERHRAALAAEGLSLESEVVRLQGPALLWRSVAGFLGWLPALLATVAGALHHAVPFAVTRLLVSRRTHAGRSWLAVYRLLFSLPCYGVWYALVFWALARWTNLWLASLWTLAMPPAGIIALRYCHRLADIIRLWCQEARMALRPRRLDQLRQEQARLRGELQAMADDFRRLPKPHNPAQPRPPS